MWAGRRRTQHKKWSDKQTGRRQTVISLSLHCQLSSKLMSVYALVAVCGVFILYA